MIEELIKEFDALTIEDITTDHDTPNGTEEIVIEIYLNKETKYLKQSKKFINKLKMYCHNVQYDAETFKPSIMIYIMKEDEKNESPKRN